MSLQLEYNYAVINTTTGMCGACFTTTTRRDSPAYIEVPYTTDDYVRKYYNLNGDQMWYWDENFTDLWEECPSHNV